MEEDILVWRVYVDASNDVKLQYKKYSESSDWHNVVVIDNALRTLSLRHLPEDEDGLVKDEQGRIKIA